MMNPWISLDLPSKIIILATCPTLASLRQMKRQGTENTCKLRLVGPDLDRVDHKAVDIRSAPQDRRLRKRTLSPSLEENTKSLRLGNSRERFQQDHPLHQEENGQCPSLWRIPTVSQLQLSGRTVSTNATTATASPEVPS